MTDPTITPPAPAGGEDAFRARTTTLVTAGIAIGLLVLFAGAGVGAFVTADDDLKKTLVETLKYGIVAVISFYLGSSASGQKKDDAAAKVAQRLADKV